MKKLHKRFTFEKYIFSQSHRLLFTGGTQVPSLQAWNSPPILVPQVNCMKVKVENSPLPAVADPAAGKRGGRET